MSNPGTGIPWLDRTDFTPNGDGTFSTTSGLVGQPAEPIEGEE